MNARTIQAFDTPLQSNQCTNRIHRMHRAQLMERLNENIIERSGDWIQYTLNDR